MGDLNIQRDAQLDKALLVTAKDITIEQKRTLTKVDFHHTSPVEVSSPVAFSFKKLARTVVVGPNTVVIHQAFDGTETRFAKNEIHESDEVTEKKEKAKQHREVKERAAAAALAQAKQHHPSQLKRGKPVTRIKKRKSEEGLYSLSKRPSTETLKDAETVPEFGLSEQEYPIVHSKAPINFSPSSK